MIGPFLRGKPLLDGDLDLRRNRSAIAGREFFEAIFQFTRNTAPDEFADVSILGFGVRFWVLWFHDSIVHAWQPKATIK